MINQISLGVQRAPSSAGVALAELPGSAGQLKAEWHFHLPFCSCHLLSLYFVFVFDFVAQAADLFGKTVQLWSFPKYTGRKFVNQLENSAGIIQIMIIRQTKINTNPL